jgi:hypothetical protein
MSFQVHVVISIVVDQILFSDPNQEESCKCNLGKVRRDSSISGASLSPPWLGKLMPMRSSAFAVELTSPIRQTAMKRSFIKTLNFPAFISEHILAELEEI